MPRIKDPNAPKRTRKPRDPNAPKKVRKPRDPNGPEKRYRKRTERILVTGQDAAIEASKKKSRDTQAIALKEDAEYRAALASKGWKNGFPSKPGVFQTTIYGNASFRHWDGKLWSLPWFPGASPCAAPESMPRVQEKANSIIMWSEYDE